MISADWYDSFFDRPDAVELKVTQLRLVCNMPRCAYLENSSIFSLSIAISLRSGTPVYIILPDARKNGEYELVRNSQESAKNGADALIGSRLQRHAPYA